MSEGRSTLTPMPDTDSATTTETLDRTIHQRHCPRCAKTTAQHRLLGGGWLCYSCYRAGRVSLSVRDTMRIKLADENRGPWAQRAGRIRWELGESETMFAAAVNRLIDDPEAIAAFPMETARLRRLREQRRAARRAS